ncbi:MAG: FapA family protein [Planctomycetota bacterium]|nr:FapA family protein [Planctomycetota bacterium]
MSLEDVGHRLKVFISPDRLRATLVIDAGVDPDAVTDQLVNIALDEKGLARTQDRDDRVRDAVRSFRAAAQAGSQTERFQHVIAEGAAPVHGDDASLEMLAERADTEAEAQPESTGPANKAGPHDRPVAPHATPAGDGSLGHDEASDEEGDEGSVDFYAQSAFRPVVANQPIARWRQETAGCDGVDVFGKAIACKPGKPLQLVTDDSTIKLADGTILATCDGLVHRKGNVLRISKQLRIGSYVDFSTGNVDVPGDVIVDKGVRDLFTVRAGRSILVRGLVEAAKLECQRDMRLERGMAGREKGTLNAGRDLNAHYLDRVSGEVGRDLLVSAEITGCQLGVGRHLKGPTASLMGGRVAAGGTVELSEIGAAAGSSTELILGQSVVLDELRRRVEELMAQSEQHATKVRDELESLTRAAIKLTPAQAERMTELQFETDNFRLRKERLTKSLDEISTCGTHFGNGSLTFHKAIHPGVILAIGRYRVEIKTTIRGPGMIELPAKGPPRLKLLTTGAEQSLDAVARVYQDGPAATLSKSKRAA